MSKTSARRDRATLTRRVYDIDPAAYPAQAPLPKQAGFLLRYAVLAPSSHNTQPWLFHVDEDTIILQPDPAQWLQVADADKREYYISIGCALENLSIAAEAFGIAADVAYPEKLDAPASITLSGTGGPPNDATLLDAMRARRTSRCHYRAAPAPAPFLEACSRIAGEHGLLLQELGPDARALAQDLTAEADMRQFGDPAWRQELRQWIRRGVFGHWRITAALGGAVVSRLDMGKSTARRNRRLLEDTPHLMLIWSAEDSAEARVRVGQCYQRIAVLAAAKGLTTHPVSQALQLPDLKVRFTPPPDAPQHTPQHLFRLGAPRRGTSPTPRWPAETLCF